MKQVGETSVIVVVYADDLLLASSCENLVDLVAKQIAANLRFV